MDTVPLFLGGMVELPLMDLIIIIFQITKPRRMESSNVRKKIKVTTKSEKRTVTCDVGTAQCEDKTVEYEKKVT